MAKSPPDVMITSTSNPHFKELLSLRDKKSRDATGLFIINGDKPIAMALQNNVEIVEVVILASLLSEPFLPDNLKNLPELQQTLLSPELFARLAYANNPESVLLVARKREHRIDKIILSDNPLLLIAEQIEKPGNIGALLRTCDAVAADALILLGQRTDIYNPNVIRASLGTIFSVPVALADYTDTLLWLQNNHIKIILAEPTAPQLYTAIDYRRPVALAMGSEAWGLSAQLTSLEPERVNIPMQGQADSLNVSNSAAILLYEVIRQRAGKHSK